MTAVADQLTPRTSVWVLVDLFNKRITFSEIKHAHCPACGISFKHATDLGRVPINPNHDD